MRCCRFQIFNSGENRVPTSPKPQISYRLAFLVPFTRGAILYRLAFCDLAWNAARQTIVGNCFDCQHVFLSCYSLQRERSRSGVFPDAISHFRICDRRIRRVRRERSQTCCRVRNYLLLGLLMVVTSTMVLTAASPFGWHSFPLLRYGCHNSLWPADSRCSTNRKSTCLGHRSCVIFALLVSLANYFFCADNIWDAADEITGIIVADAFMVTLALIMHRYVEKPFR